MCDPLTAAIIAGVASVGGTAANFIMQSKSAAAQEKALREQMVVAKEETRRETSAELFDSARAARREQGKIRAQAGESGLSLTSGSIEAMLLDSAMQSELRADRTLSNMESRNRANAAEAESAASRIQKPSILTAGLQIAGAGASMYSGISDAKIKMGK